MSQLQSFEAWLHDNPPPTIADLLLMCGNFSAIPAAAWEEHEQAMARWQAAYRQRHREVEGR